MEIIYSGANQDAIRRGTKMGFSSQRCATVEASPMGMQTMCRLTSRQISNGSVGFTQEEQERCQILRNYINLVIIIMILNQMMTV